VVMAPERIVKPVRAVGGFYAMALDAAVEMFKPPFAWREFVLQTWFVARVAVIPTLFLAIPFTVLVVFTLNVLLTEFGATDFSGTGAAGAAVTEIGPIVTVLVVAGTGATAMCADLGARTIRDEIDALRVMGVDPIHRLVVPRVMAATVVAVSLVSLVTFVGLVGSFAFAVFVQHVTPGAFAAGLTLFTGLPDIILGVVKGALFGVAAALIACYKGMSVRRGPQGVGNAVNETVVYSFVALFVINVLATAVYYTSFK
jgi:phospholipid/cholesterol/gamma-HCH transport system permease protein